MCAYDTKKINLNLVEVTDLQYYIYGYGKNNELQNELDS